MRGRVARGESVWHASAPVCLGLGASRGPEHDWCLHPLPGEPRWQLLATVQGHHPSTIFSVDWGQQGQIASGCADNAIRVFAEASAAAEPGTSPGASSCGGEGAVPSVRQLFLKQQEQQQQQWVLQCTHEQAHDADVNCVRWHPHTPGLLASAGDDGIVRLWLYTPPPASECNE